MSESDEGAVLAARELLHKRVYDLNGHRLGRVARCVERDGQVVSVDVALDRKARIAFDAPGDVLRVPIADVVATDFQVSLSEDALHLVHPERAPPPSHE